MCEEVYATYTEKRVPLGLGIVRIEQYADSQFVRAEIVDTLLRQPKCCWSGSPYTRALTDDDVDISKCDHVGSTFQSLINDRRAYMQRIANEAEKAAQREKGSRCTML